MDKTKIARKNYDKEHQEDYALELSRKLKPSIPEIGDFGIPIRHEIEFEMVL